MEQKFKQFFDLNNGKAVEAEDASNYAQCFDLAFAWCDYIGIPREAIRHFRAFEIWTASTMLTEQYFDLIPNTPDGIPQVGDIVVFGTGIGVSGHVSIASGVADTQSLTTFDQNWNGHAYCELVTHNYDSGPVLGWLRAKNPAIANVISQDATVVHDRDENWQVASAISTELGVAPNPDNKEDMKTKAVQAVIDLKAQINTLQGVVSEDKKTHEQDLQTITDIKNQLATLNQEDADYAQKALDAEHTASDAQARIILTNKMLGLADTAEIYEVEAKIKELQKPIDQAVAPIVQQHQEFANILFSDFVYKRVPKQAQGIVNSIVNIIGNLFKK